MDNTKTKGGGGGGGGGGDCLPYQHTGDWMTEMAGSWQTKLKNAF